MGSAPYSWSGPEKKMVPLRLRASVLAARHGIQQPTHPIASSFTWQVYNDHYQASLTLSSVSCLCLCVCLYVCLLSPVSCLLSPVSCLLSPVSVSALFPCSLLLHFLTLSLIVLMQTLTHAILDRFDRAGWDISESYNALLMRLGGFRPSRRVSSEELPEVLPAEPQSAALLKHIVALSHSRAVCAASFAAVDHTAAVFGFVGARYASLSPCCLSYQLLSCVFSRLERWNLPLTQRTSGERPGVSHCPWSGCDDGSCGLGCRTCSPTRRDGVVLSAGDCGKRRGAQDCLCCT